MIIFLSYVVLAIVAYIIGYEIGHAACFRYVQRLLDGK